MDPLATPTDLANRHIPVDDPWTVSAFLRAASAAVREAAGVPISSLTSTVTTGGDRDCFLQLPGPVTDVIAVDIDGGEVTDYKVLDGRLWRRGGWGGCSAEVTVEFTHGYDPVPEDIVDLVCSMVGAALKRAGEEGYASRGDLISTRVDDYSEQYASDVATRTAGPMELPPLTAATLRARFSGSTYVVGSR